MGKKIFLITDDLKYIEMQSSSSKPPDERCLFDGVLYVRKHSYWDSQSSSLHYIFTPDEDFATIVAAHLGLASSRTNQSLLPPLCVGDAINLAVPALTLNIQTYTQVNGAESIQTHKQRFEYLLRIHADDSYFSGLPRRQQFDFTTSPTDQTTQSFFNLLDISLQEHNNNCLEFAVESWLRKYPNLIFDPDTYRMKNTLTVSFLPQNFIGACANYGGKLGLQDICGNSLAGMEHSNYEITNALPYNVGLVFTLIANSNHPPGALRVQALGWDDVFLKRRDKLWFFQPDLNSHKGIFEI